MMMMIILRGKRKKLLPASDEPLCEAHESSQMIQIDYVYRKYVCRYIIDIDRRHERGEDQMIF